jgi:hypothetical protein
VKTQRQDDLLQPPKKLRERKKEQTRMFDAEAGDLMMIEEEDYALFLFMRLMKLLSEPWMWDKVSFNSG